MKLDKPTIGACVRRRFFRAAILSGLVATPVVGFLGCSGSSELGSNGPTPCDSTYKDSCGKPCTEDTDCDSGLYCGASGCTADCDPGHDCGEGQLCAPQGRCVSSPIFGGDAGLSGGGTGLNKDTACVNDRRTGEGIPADIYIMNDRSGSMSCQIPPRGDRWDAMKTALTGFINSKEAAGLGVGIQYFGLETGAGPFGPSIGRQDRNGGSCNPADYMTAAVEIAPLPGNAKALIGALGATNPGSFTPTPAALEGAIAHAKAFAMKHPDHVVSVVLATDGEPNLLMQGDQCAQAGQDTQLIQQYINQVAKVAKTGFDGTPKIPTYVIGIVDGSGSCQSDPQPPKQADLDVVANAGGTGKAFIVSATNGNTSVEFLDALNKIRGAAVVPCQYVLPATSADGQAVDANKVNITLTPGGGKEAELTQAADAKACPATGGWYYADSTQKKIELCPASCNIVSADARAAVQVLLGCATVVGPIR